MVVKLESSNNFSFFFLKQNLPHIFKEDVNKINLRVLLILSIQTPDR